MRKSLISYLLIAIVISGLVFISNVHFGTVSGSTEFSGIISTDTTWTKTGSPYNLTGNVLIDKDVTVTIQADTTVNLDSYYIRVNGSLIIEQGATINMETKDAGIQVNGLLNARGTNNNPVRINGAYGYYAWIAPPVYSAITFSQSATGWNDQTGRGSILENMIIDSTSIETSASIKISNDRVTSGGITLSSGSSLVVNNVITGTVNIKGGSPTISQNSISGGSISFYVEDYGSDNVIISDNIIDHATGGNSAGIWFGGSRSYGGHLLVERNLITNNYNGIMIFSPNYENLNTVLTIHDNTITNNTVGIFVTNSYVPTITGNNINDNNQNIKLATDYSGHSKDFSAANNWWGTIDRATIDQKIWDFNDDFNLGKVSYDPFLTSPNPNAMPDPNASIPTINTSPTPSSTSNSTSTPSTSPTQNPTATPDQSGSQNALGLDWIQVVTLILLGVIAVLLVFVVVFLRRRSMK